MKILGIIPARFASTRFPAKPLAEIGGKSMIQRVYEQVNKSGSLHSVIIATDHPRIYDHAIHFGGKVCMTREDHASGTDRCNEVLSLQEEKFDYVINIQGDEPFIKPQQIDLLASILDGKTEIATLIKQIESKEMLFNPNVVKAVITKHNEALYFSRASVPYIRNFSEDQWMDKNRFYKHIGMYAYRSDILPKISNLPLGSLEKAESLEQLRWLENGFRIAVAETQEDSLGIDTPEDLQKAIEYLSFIDY